MKNMKGKKGITLVALVITIILLLILAGISIATLTGSGLFEKARLAEQKSTEKQEEEERTLKDYENKIDEYVDGTRNETIKSKVLFEGAQSSGTITFENDKINDYNTFEFIFGFDLNTGKGGRIFSEIVSKEFLQLECLNEDWKFISGLGGSTAMCSVKITNVTENSIEFEAVASGTSWSSYTCYIYKIIGRK